MKLLKLKTNSGFKMLKKGFEINFLTKTRVDKNSLNDDLIEFGSDFYYPIETIFIGKNSSGKTTVLELINIALDILNEGRVKRTYFEYNDTFSVEIIFYVSGIIYNYSASYKNDALDDRAFLTIIDESLTKTSFKDSYRKDLSNASYFKVNDFVNNIGSDTSNIKKYANDGSFNVTLSSFADYPNNFGLFYDFLGKDVFNALLKLFDDSVDYIKPIKDNRLKDGYTIKRVGNGKAFNVDVLTLKKILSRGTVRGINLYALSIITFMNGGHLIVDEIESSFNRNLIENLIIMFNDKTINKKDGSIIYSTHYSELLDMGNRCDNVNVLNRNETSISIMNMHENYDVRVDMLKSSQFDQNTFDTLINYNRLMDLKETIRSRN